MPRVVHFEISADEPERAINFYTNVFGWSFQKWESPEPYWLVTTGEEGEPGINGGLFIRKGPVGHVNTIEVDDLDAFLDKAIANGGKIAVPKMAVPGVGYLAYCQDTEESVFGIMQMDATAKL